MEPLIRVTGVAAPLLRDNIDTDAIVPSRETRSVARDGYAEKLFANWRYTPGTRDENPRFVLNREPFRDAVILLAGRNFGCGSSREAAVWSLAQFGIRCVVAPSFGEIFRGNCIRNGVLPAVVEAGTLAPLAEAVSRAPDRERLTVDLRHTSITATSGIVVTFEIPAFDREALLTGKEEIELTLDAGDRIRTFEERDRQRRPWAHHLPAWP